MFSVCLFIQPFIKLIFKAYTLLYVSFVLGPGDTVPAIVGLNSIPVPDFRNSRVLK